MYKKQGYMGGGYGTNISPMDMKNKDRMDEQMRTPKAIGGMHMSKKGNASIIFDKEFKKDLKLKTKTDTKNKSFTISLSKVF